MTPTETPHTLSERELREASLGELCDYIVDKHHALLRAELPRIGGQLDKIAARHGRERPALIELRQVFAELRDELLEHIDCEEGKLFPVCRALDDGGTGSLPSPTTETLWMHEKAHSKVHDRLAALRRLGDGYRTDLAVCSCHRSLLESLDALERDLRQHIHAENCVLFPQLRKRFDLEPMPTA